MRLVEEDIPKIFRWFDDTSDELSDVEKEIWKKITSESIKNAMLKDDYRRERDLNPRVQCTDAILLFDFEASALTKLGYPDE